MAISNNANEVVDLSWVKAFERHIDSRLQDVAYRKDWVRGGVTDPNYMLVYGGSASYADKQWLIDAYTKAGWHRVSVINSDERGDERPGLCCITLYINPLPLDALAPASEAQTVVNTPLVLAAGEILVSTLSIAGRQPYHLILLPGQADNSWEEATQWATSIGGCLPARYEQFLLFATHPHQFASTLYWSVETCSLDPLFAWCLDFSSGVHDTHAKRGKARAKAIRRVLAE